MNLADRLGNLRAGGATTFCTERHIGQTHIARRTGFPRYKAQGLNAAQKFTRTHNGAMEKRATKSANSMTE